MKTQKQRLAAVMFAALVCVCTVLPTASPRLANWTYTLLQATTTNGTVFDPWAFAAAGVGVGTLIAPGVGTIVGLFAGL